MREDAGRRYVESEVAALEHEQAKTDELASQLETRLRAVMKSGLHASISLSRVSCNTHPFYGLFPGLPGWAVTIKVKPICILLKQETVSGSGISWAICKSASRSRQIIMPAPHHSVFYRLDALPAAQPTASKHWRKLESAVRVILIFFVFWASLCVNIWGFWSVCWYCLAPHHCQKGISRGWITGQLSVGVGIDTERKGRGFLSLLRDKCSHVPLNRQMDVLTQSGLDSLPVPYAVC